MTSEQMIRQATLDGDIRSLTMTCEIYGEHGCQNEAAVLATFRWGAITCEMKVCEACLSEEQEDGCVKKHRPLHEREVL